MQQPSIILRTVSKVLEKEVLHNLSLQVEKQRFLVLLDLLDRGKQRSLK